MSSVRLSVCLSSVTFVRPTHAIEIFGSVSIPFGTLAIQSSWATGIPGNRGSPKFPAGIPGNFWNSGGNYGEFIWVLSFSIVIVDYDILVFNASTLCSKKSHYNYGTPYQN